MSRAEEMMQPCLFHLHYHLFGCASHPLGIAGPTDRATSTDLNPDGVNAGSMAAVLTRLRGLPSSRVE